MSLLKIHQTLPMASVNEIIFDLFHSGQCVIAGYTLYVDSCVLPVPEKFKDCVRWRFPQAVKVSTPGPDSQIGDVLQYRDRIEFNVWPWASIRLDLR